MFKKYKVKKDTLKSIRGAAKKLVGQSMQTGGCGWWTSEVRDVKIKKITVDNVEDIFLRVYFEPESWDVTKHGLIYTDYHWLSEFQHALKKAGFEDADEIDFTEQGMQGETYVHLILGDW